MSHSYTYTLYDSYEHYNTASLPEVGDREQKAEQ